VRRDEKKGDDLTFDEERLPLNFKPGGPRYGGSTYSKRVLHHPVRTAGKIRDDVEHDRVSTGVIHIIGASTLTVPIVLPIVF
jgi:hypothetical protein